MPIYEYACPACGHDFETIHKVSDPAPPCPQCGKDVQKKISLAAFHLKGSGWYSDAYAGKDNKKPGASSTSSDSSSSGDTSSTSTSSGDSSSSSSTSSDSSSTSSSSSSSAASAAE